MNKVTKKIKQCGSACEYCDLDFLCGKLKSALVVLEKYIENESTLNAELDTYYGTLLDLERAGWDFPFNEKKCKFENAGRAVSRHTDRIIKVL